MTIPGGGGAGGLGLGFWGRVRVRRRRRSLRPLGVGAAGLWRGWTGMEAAASSRSSQMSKGGGDAIPARADRGWIVAESDGSASEGEEYINGEFRILLPLVVPVRRHFKFRIHWPFDLILSFFSSIKT
jgi:hypothetical protein